jgi:high-affinity iron transporter
VFEALLITLREGIEAALVVGIILTYLDKSGRAALRPAVLWGLASGIGASLVAAVLVSRLGIAEEQYEGWLMLLGALFVMTMVVWIWRTARGLKKEIEARVASIAGRPAGAVAFGLFALTFLLVLREGIETVLFLAAIDLTTEALQTALGGLVGLGLAVAFGVSLVRGTVRVDLGKFFKVTEIVLIVLAAQLLVGGIHELGEAGTIPVGRDEMRLIGPIVKSDALVMAALLALPLLMLATTGRRHRERAAAAEKLEGPERRLAVAALRREVLWRRLLAIAGVVIVASLTMSYAFTRLPQGIDPPAMLTAIPGGGSGMGGGTADANPTGAPNEVRVPTRGLDDGHLHRFGVSIDGTVVRIIVLKSRGKLIPAFDACVVCGARGYVERKSRLVCLNCAADINTATLGVGGGCNPIPLKYREEGDALVIAVSDLKEQLAAFRNTEGSSRAAEAAAPRR